MGCAAVGCTGTSFSYQPVRIINDDLIQLPLYFNYCFTTSVNSETRLRRIETLFKADLKSSQPRTELCRAELT